MTMKVCEWHNFLAYFPLDKAQWRFKAAENLTPPFLLYYSGVLPATPRQFHLFVVCQLKGANNESSTNRTMPQPRMLHRRASHDFTMVYVDGAAPQERDLLFHFQISGSDLTAKQLAHTLVEACLQAGPKDANYLGDRRQRLFWADLAQTKLEQLQVEARVWVDDDSLNG